MLDLRKSNYSFGDQLHLFSLVFFLVGSVIVGFIISLLVGNLITSSWIFQSSIAGGMIDDPTNF